MRILVTGGCGFVGSNFINYIVDKYPNYYIVNIDAMYYSASQDYIHTQVKSSSNYKFIEGYVQDFSLIKYILKSEKITHIIHFAAQSHVDTSFKNSIQYTEDNVKGTHILLESVRIINPNIVFLHFSTDEVYGESKIHENAKTETSVLMPTNPYAASKAAAEMYVHSYRHSYKLNTIITRGNNIYGPNQHKEKLIPKCIDYIKTGKKFTIHGNGMAKRSFLYVDDVCNAIDIIIHKGIIGEIYNIGSEDHSEFTIIEVVKKILDLMGIPQKDHTEFIEYVSDRPFNDKRYFISNNKLKHLGWKQCITFEDGLKLLF